MTQRYKSKPEHDRLVRDEAADPIERASAMSLLAFDQLYEFEPVAAEWLQHREAFLRAEAVKVLVGRWDKVAYLDEAMRLLHFDPEWVVRAGAAFALSQFIELSKQSDQYKEQIVRELVRALLQDKDWKVQESIYQGLWKVLKFGSTYNYSSGKFDRDRDVDWELLKPYLDDQNRSGRRHELRV
ncbi:MAG: HEAT repeat domain-containing protein [Pyrinomonadaceae bacterium]|nr:HEAT repeat domain-containing protein [Pyrinomonadaceae bacterium]